MCVRVCVSPPSLRCPLALSAALFLFLPHAAYLSLALYLLSVSRFDRSLLFPRSPLKPGSGAAANLLQLDQIKANCSARWETRLTQLNVNLVKHGHLCSHLRFGKDGHRFLLFESIRPPHIDSLNACNEPHPSTSFYLTYLYLLHTHTHTHTDVTHTTGFLFTECYLVQSSIGRFELSAS